MQAVYVWLFSCFSTQVSLIFPFFLYICLSFLQESEIFFAQENEISKIYQRHKKGALQEMQYVC